MIRITPAVLPSSTKDFDDKLALLARLPSVSHVQIDVVDGRFATPVSWPYTAPQEFRSRIVRGEMLPVLDRVTYEIDLMCFNARHEAEAWVELGASRLTFHAESANDLGRFLESARTFYGHGLIAFGLALGIETDLSLIEPHLDYVDYVQFMGIARIGRQGQPFDPRVFEKIRIFHERHPGMAMQVDGGVSLDNARKLISLGISNLIVGSAILRAKDPEAALEMFDAL